MALEYLSAGTVVTDFVASLTVGGTLSGTYLYKGRVMGLAAASCLGTAQTTYGAWSGAGKTGTRYKCIATGIPGSSAEVLWDLQSGRLYSTVSRGTVYVRYLKYADLFNQGRIYGPMNIPFMLIGTVSDIYADRCPWDEVKFGEYQISVDGSRPTGTLSLAVYGATGASGSYATITLTGAESRCTQWKNIAGGGLTMTARKMVVLRGGGSGFSNIKVTLREKME